MKKKIFLNLLPMKCELLVWKNSLKHLISGFRWKHFISIPYFYLLDHLDKQVMASKKKLPLSIGSFNKRKFYESSNSMWRCWSTC